MLLLVFAACEGESPTEPTRGGGGGGATTPPQNASIALAVSNPTPLVGSTSTITATVTIASQPVPNGTAVEFSTNLGAFQDTSSNSTVRTTTGGVASAVLTSSAAGTATVTVRVNNVTAVAQITFSQQSTEPPPPDSAPAITAISPAQGKPAGGDLVTITGRNFEPPLRVLFGDTPAQIVSSTSTQISVISPPIQLGVSEQAREVTITVITKAGTSGEARATGGPFRYQLQVLTPTVFHVSPASGSNDGNTRITIIGEGFQSPVKVFFGTGAGSAGGLQNQVEVNVEQVSFSQIIALTPPATGMGAAFANQQVTVRVMNVGSNTQFTLPDAFRYGPEMRITAVSPTQGSAFESTKVTIEGWGFDDQKVAVTVGGLAAQPIFVSGTKIIVQTALPVVNSCGNFGGAISVTNIEDGTSATAPSQFTFLVPNPAITSVTPNPAAPGSSITITVAGAGPGPARFRVGDVTLAVSGTPVFSGLDASYQVVLPNSFEFNTQTCVTTLGVEGEQFVETPFDVQFQNILSGCEDTFTNGLRITPPDTSCRVPPATIAVSGTTSYGTLAVGAAPKTNIFTVTNNGGQALTLLTVSEQGETPSTENNFTIASDNCTGNLLGPGASCSFSVQFDPSDATTPNKAAQYLVDTNVNDVTLNLTGTATP
ncbi:MAG TPA: IPT/TIG domain-containing protein [Thermoanaerobaculia bacterium]|nr:IPT/TIG domain-containing protein [Thermoanaerobaculia bacterium]